MVRSEEVLRLREQIVPSCKPVAWTVVDWYHSGTSRTAVENSAVVDERIADIASD